MVSFMKSNAQDRGTLKKYDKESLTSLSTTRLGPRGPVMAAALRSVSKCWWRASVSRYG